MAALVRDAPQPSPGGAKGEDAVHTRLIGAGMRARQLSGFPLRDQTFYRKRDQLFSVSAVRSGSPRRESRFQEVPSLVAGSSGGGLRLARWDKSRYLHVGVAQPVLPSSAPSCSASNTHPALAIWDIAMNALLLAEGKPALPETPVPDLLDFLYPGNRLHPT